MLGADNYIGTINIICNPQGRVSNKMSKTSDFHLLYAKNKEEISDDIRVMKLDNKKSEKVPLKRTGTNSRREDRPLRYFPILYNLVF